MVKHFGSKAVSEAVARAHAARRSIRPGGKYAAQVETDTASILGAWSMRPTTAPLLPGTVIAFRSLVKP